MEIGRIIAENMARLRAERSISLSTLSEASGVSKAMLSQVERGEANPTVNTLWQIATGLNVPYSALMEPQSVDATVVRYDDVPEQPDEDGMYRIRCFFQSNPTRDFEIFTGVFEPGCVHETKGHTSGSREYVYVEKGSVVITVDGTAHELFAGDWIGFDASRPHEYSNVTDEASHLVFINHYPG